MLKSVAAGLKSWGIVAGAAAARVVPALLRDLVALGGVAAIAYGAWLIYAPAGFIAGGALVLIGALLAAKR